MTLEDLRVFVAVYEAGNLTAVAQALGRTQQAVSNHVRQLERELDVELFSRGRRGVEPTPEGQRLYEGASGALAVLRDSIELLQAPGGSKEEGPLALASGGPLARHFLGLAFRRVRSKWPQLRIHLEVGNTTVLCLEHLRARRADLAFVVIPEDPRGLELRPVLEMPFMALVPKGDPLESRGRLAVRDLQRLRYLSLPESTASAALIRSAAAAAGIEPTPSMTVGDIDTAVLCVELAMGHAILPAAIALRAEQSGHARAIRIQGLPGVRLGWSSRRFSLLPGPALELMEVFSSTTHRWSGFAGVRVLAAG